MSNISGASVPSSQRARYFAISSSVHPAAALERSLRLGTLQTDGRIIVRFDMLLVDHPADHMSQRRQQIAGLNRSARLHLLAQDPARQCRERSFAVVTKQRLDQPGPRVSRAFGKSFFTNRRVAQPAVALLVERPVPTQAAGKGRCCRKRRAFFAPLLLGANRRRCRKCDASENAPQPTLPGCRDQPPLGLPPTKPPRLFGPGSL